MKSFLTIAAGVMLLAATSASAQQATYQEINFADSTGMPGDNFSLEAALNLFKNSRNLEEFEKSLNSKDTAINNLDLNGDGKIDYIRVEDHIKDQAHAIVLQIAVNEREKQDVAVIEIEKTGEQSAVAQIIGDEELYGEQKIVEAVNKDEAPDPGGKVNGKGPSAPAVYAPQYVYVNVWWWPCVSYIYAPAYVVWVSPWYWGYYPPWFYPWPPYNWQWYYMNHWHYHSYYYRTYYHRTTYAHNTVYAPRRNYSPAVNDRYRPARERYISTRPARPAVTPRPANRPDYQRPAPRPDVRPAPAPRPTPIPAPAPTPTPKRQDYTPPKQVSPAPRPTTPSRPPQPPPSQPRPQNQGNRPR